MENILLPLSPPLSKFVLKTILPFLISSCEGTVKEFWLLFLFCGWQTMCLTWQNNFQLFCVHTSMKTNCNSLFWGAHLFWKEWLKQGEMWLDGLPCSTAYRPSVCCFVFLTLDLFSYSSLLAVCGHNEIGINSVITFQYRLHLFLKEGSTISTTKAFFLYPLKSTGLILPPLFLKCWSNGPMAKTKVQMSLWLRMLL